MLPILFALLYGIITYGFTLSQSNAVENSVREASRFGATQAVTSSTANWLDDVVDVLVEGATGDLDAGTPGRYICVALAGSDDAGRVEIVGNAAPAYSSSGNCGTLTCPTSEPCVQVAAERSAELDAVVVQRSVTLDSTSVSTFEREDD